MRPKSFCFFFMQQPLRGLVWLVSAGERPLSSSAGWRKIKTKIQQWNKAKKWEQRKVTGHIHCRPSSPLHTGILFSHSCRWTSYWQ